MVSHHKNNCELHKLQLKTSAGTQMLRYTHAFAVNSAIFEMTHLKMGVLKSERII